ncbi:MAG: hypothetical protein ACK5QT_01785 [Oligoflexia bacterium]|jgi:hypothetical protein
MRHLLKRALCGLAALGGLAVTGGCALGFGKSVHQYGLSEVVSVNGGERSRSIESEGFQDVVLFFAFNTHYADDAREKLLSQCPKGRIVGISAKYSTDLGVFAYKNRLRLKATCLEPRS